MNIIAKYIHGSADSVDIDTCYVTDYEFTYNEGKAFCDSIKGENANLIRIEDRIVVQVYKGIPDELNNSVYTTYGLHEQEYPLLITRRVERNIPLKCVRAVRALLSHISRSEYRPQVKKALVDANWNNRLDVISSIPYCNIDYDTMNKNISGSDTLKVIAFQVGQSLALLNGKEIYTKGEIADEYPQLRQFLYREDVQHLNDLQEMINLFVLTLREHFGDVKQDGYIAEFPQYNMYINLKTEQVLKVMPFNT